jgi:hypothetical protein
MLKTEVKPLNQILRCHRLGKELLMKNTNKGYLNYAKYHYNYYMEKSVDGTLRVITREECFSHVDDTASVAQFPQRYIFDPDFIENPKGNYVGGHVIKLPRTAEGEEEYKTNIRKLWARTQKNFRLTKDGFLSPASYDELCETGGIPEMADTTSLADVVGDKLFAESLHAKLNAIDAELNVVLDALMLDMTMRDLARLLSANEADKSLETISRRLYRKHEKLKKLVREFLNDYEYQTLHYPTLCPFYAVFKALERSRYARKRYRQQNYEIFEGSAELLVL